MGRLDLRDPSRDEDVYQLVLKHPLPDRLVNALQREDGRSAMALAHGRKSDLKALRR